MQNEQQENMSDELSGVHFVFWVTFTVDIERPGSQPSAQSSRQLNSCPSVTGDSDELVLVVYILVCVLSEPRHAPHHSLLPVVWERSVVICLTPLTPASNDGW